MGLIEVIFEKAILDDDLVLRWDGGMDRRPEYVLSTAEWTGRVDEDIDIVVSAREEAAFWDGERGREAVDDVIISLVRDVEVDPRLKPTLKFFVSLLAFLL